MEEKSVYYAWFTWSFVLLDEQLISELKKEFNLFKLNIFHINNFSCIFGVINEYLQMFGQEYIAW